MTTAIVCVVLSLLLFAGAFLLYRWMKLPAKPVPIPLRERPTAELLMLPECSGIRTTYDPKSQVFSATHGDTWDLIVLPWALGQDGKLFWSVKAMQHYLRGEEDRHNTRAHLCLKAHGDIGRGVCPACDHNRALWSKVDVSKPDHYRTPEATAARESKAMARAYYNVVRVSRDEEGNKCYSDVLVASFGRFAMDKINKALDEFMEEVGVGLPTIRYTKKFRTNGTQFPEFDATLRFTSLMSEDADIIQAMSNRYDFDTLIDGWRETPEAMEQALARSNVLYPLVEAAACTKEDDLNFLRELTAMCDDH